MIAVFFAFLTFFGWAVGDLFIALSGRRIGALRTYFWGNVISLVLTSLYIPLAGGISSWPMFLIAFLLGIMLSVGTFSYIHALAVGNASLAGAIGGAFPIITVFLSLIFFGEKLTFIQTVGIIFTIVGVVLTSLDFQKLHKERRSKIFSDRAVPLTLFSVILWGFYYAFIRIPVEKIGWFWACYPINFVFIFLLFFEKKKRDLFRVFKDNKAIIFLVFYTVFITVAQFSYNLGISSGFTSIVAPVAGAYPVLFVVLTRLVFKEKLTKQQSLGIIAALLGIILISLSHLKFVN